MRNFTRAAATLAAAALLVGVTALPASAEDTPSTATVTGGVLSISVPASAALLSSGPGVNAIGTLGTVTVTDNTASTAGWDATVTVTDFTSVTLGAPVIGKAEFTYVPSSAVVSGAGAGVVTKSTVTGGLGGIVQAATASGNNAATWTANLTLAVPATALAADYTATLTHSVL